MRGAQLLHPHAHLGTRSGKKKKKAVGLGTRDIAAQGTRVTGLPGLGTHSDDSPVAPAGDRSPLEAEVLPPSVPPKALLSGW